MRCPECDFGFVETLPSDRRKHRSYHDRMLFGLKLPALRQLPAAWRSDGKSVRVVSAESPRAYRSIAQDLSLLAAGDVDFSFVAYHADEPTDGRNPQIFIGVDADRAVSYVMLEVRSHIWRCTWEEYHAGVTHAVTNVNRVWSVSFAWVSRANRRRGWMRRSLLAAAQHLGFPWSQLVWHTPFSEDGERLARGLCPDGILIGK